MTAKKDSNLSDSIPFGEIKELLEQVSDLKIEELELEKGDFRIHIIGNRPAAAVQSVVAAPTEAVVAAPAAATAPAQSAEPADSGKAAEEDDSHLKKVTSPMVGTFYRSPAPESPPFVKVGDQVSDDTVLCIIEAMKLMNEIKAEMSGKIAKIYVENGQPVEYGQPIFGIEAD